MYRDIINTLGVEAKSTVQLLCLPTSLQRNRAPLQERQSGVKWGWFDLRQRSSFQQVNQNANEDVLIISPCSWKDRLSSYGNPYDYDLYKNTVQVPYGAVRHSTVRKGHAVCTNLMVGCYNIVIRCPIIETLLVYRCTLNKCTIKLILEHQSS